MGQIASFFMAISCIAAVLFVVLVFAIIYGVGVLAGYRRGRNPND